MSDKTENFVYKYSAEEQEEIKKIREKYVPLSETENKMARLRALDRSVTKKGTIWALSVGIISALVMGSGMSFVTTDLGEILNMENSMLWGILIGVVGLVGVLLSYPVYKKITRKERERVTPEILMLADELMK